MRSKAGLSILPRLCASPSSAPIYQQICVQLLRGLFSTRENSSLLCLQFLRKGAVGLHPTTALPLTCSHHVASLRQLDPRCSLRPSSVPSPGKLLVWLLHSDEMSQPLRLRGHRLQQSPAVPPSYSQSKRTGTFYNLWRNSPWLTLLYCNPNRWEELLVDIRLS